MISTAAAKKPKWDQMTDFISPAHERRELGAICRSASGDCPDREALKEKRAVLNGGLRQLDGMPIVATGGERQTEALG